jgi:hypothetical protein
MRKDMTITLDGPAGLTITATLSPHHPIIDEFYESYEKAFVLPNEREELQGFRDCMALNLPPDVDRLEKRYGAFREVVLVAREGKTAPLVGGANFIAFAPTPFPGDRGPAPLTINLNYLFTAAAARGRGFLRPLVAAITPTARTLLELDANVPALTFIEQNDPLAMRVEDYVRDTKATGLDQVDRIAIWARLGARVLDFPYVQPPLSASQDADEALVMSVLGAPDPQISACRLEHHLRRFFAISVLKDGDPDQLPASAGQLARAQTQCNRGSAVQLLDPLPWIEHQGATIRLKGRAPTSPPNLREALALIAPSDSENERAQ